jgi:thioredoxin reductase (NADPH)
VPKPAILAVDDDLLVLAAVQRDLRTRYAADYLVVAAGSGAEGLRILEELVTRGDPVALLLVDQRMPEMTGVQFLSASRRLFPDARRVLLTAYADTEAAIAAINEAGVHHYVLKPWDPPEDRLYPLLDDLLDDWRAVYRPTPSGVRVLGDRWSSEANRVREFLARNQVPYRSIDVEGQEGALLLEAMAVSAADLPVVLLEDGKRLIRPTGAELGEAVGLHVHAELPTYDLAIVGGGPAGLAAAVYGASEGLKTVLIEREAPGGQAGESARIENYLGFPAGLSGADLTRRAVTQSRRFGAELLVPVEARALRRSGPFRVLEFDDGSEINCKAVLVATGVSYRKLPAEGADRLVGAGVYYGASAMEAGLYEGASVAIVGAGNSAGQAALFLAGRAAEIHMLVRGPALAETMSAYLVERIASTANIHLWLRCQVEECEGVDRLQSLIVRRLDTDEIDKIEVAALFVFVGQAPRTDWLGDMVARDEQGFILTGPGAGRWDLTRSPFPLETSVPGVFAAGDVRSGSIKRVASAAGEGAMAVRFIHEHLASL